MKRNTTLGLLMLLLSVFCLPIQAQRTELKLFSSTKDTRIFRIPAITCTSNGTLIAVSGYSTFVTTSDKKIAFLYERTATVGSWQYDINFEKLSLEQITGGQYTLKR